MEAASNAGALERLLLAELLTREHETRHLLLGQLNLATAWRGYMSVNPLRCPLSRQVHRRTEGREVEVGDLVLLGGLRAHVCGVMRVSLKGIEG